jgi:hypothetical protein
VAAFPVRAVSYDLLACAGRASKRRWVRELCPGPINALGCVSAIRLVDLQHLPTGSAGSRGQAGLTMFVDRGGPARLVRRLPTSPDCLIIPT